MENKEIVEELELIAVRVPPSDRWRLIGDDENIYPSITDTLEAWFNKAQENVEFRLAPLDSKLYVIRKKEEHKTPPPPKTYNLYGEFRQGI